jgi:hypothetical protein
MYTLPMSSGSSQPAPKFSVSTPSSWMGTIPCEVKSLSLPVKVIVAA